MIVSTLGLEEPYRAQFNAAAARRPVRHCRLNELGEQELARVEILMTYGYDMPEPVLQKMPSLRWVHVGQSGMDKIPMSFLARQGILLTNSRGINSTAIAEYAMSMMLNIVRNNYKFYRQAQAHVWDLETHLDELWGKTVGILGLGMVGRELVPRAAAFGMRVLGMDIAPANLPGLEETYLPGRLEELLPQCDFVVICMPLTCENHHLINQKTLALMKPTAWLMNLARGAIVNEPELIEALNEKRIAGAVLDVFETEPLPGQSPLWSMEQVYITPHIAGDHLASYMPRMMELLCSNLAAYPQREQMRNRVDTGRGF